MQAQLSGLVSAFKHENGFGTLELEDGREVPFDVTACVEEPVAGQPVRVTLRPGRDGALRAVLVEAASQPDSTRPVTTLREAVRRLQTEGIALELDDWERHKLTTELRIPCESPGELVRLLSAYYRDPFVGERRRSEDLFVDHLSAADPCALEAELARLLGGDALGFPAREARTSSVDDVVDTFNAALRAAGDARRIVPLRTDGEHRAYFCMALSRALRLSAAGVLAVRWDRPHLTPSSPPPRDA